MACSNLLLSSFRVIISHSNILRGSKHIKFDQMNKYC